MKVSIVTVSYNQAQFLERTLRSVLDQDYGNLEYIVVDAGSTDGSIDILRNHQDQISTLIVEPDDGPPDGLNKGLRHATGEIFGYVNSSDAYLPGAIRQAAAALATNPETDMVYGDGYIIDEADIPIRHFISAPFDVWSYVHGAAKLIQPSTFFRKTALESVGGFNSQNQTCWDGELHVDLALRGKKFKHYRRYWSLFRSHANAISHPEAESKADEDRNRIYMKVMGREPGHLHQANRIVALTKKYALEPRSALLRLKDEVLGPPRRDLHLEPISARTQLVKSASA